MSKFMQYIKYTTLLISLIVFSGCASRFPNTESFNKYEMNVVERDIDYSACLHKTYKYPDYDVLKTTCSTSQGKTTCISYTETEKGSTVNVDEIACMRNKGYSYTP